MFIKTSKKYTKLTVNHARALSSFSVKFTMPYLLKVFKIMSLDQDIEYYKRFVERYKCLIKELHKTMAADCFTIGSSFYLLFVFLERKWRMLNIRDLIIAFSLFFDIEEDSNQPQIILIESVIKCAKEHPELFTIIEESIKKMKQGLPGETPQKNQVPDTRQAQNNHQLQEREENYGARHALGRPHVQQEQQTQELLTKENLLMLIEKGKMYMFHKLAGCVRVPVDANTFLLAGIKNAQTNIFKISRALRQENIEAPSAPSWTSINPLRNVNSAAYNDAELIIHKLITQVIDAFQEVADRERLSNTDRNEFQRDGDSTHNTYLDTLSTEIELWTKFMASDLKTIQYEALCCYRDAYPAENLGKFQPARWKRYQEYHSDPPKVASILDHFQRFYRHVRATACPLFISPLGFEIIDRGRMPDSITELLAPPLLRMPHENLATTAAEMKAEQEQKNLPTQIRLIGRRPKYTLDEYLKSDDAKRAMRGSKDVFVNIVQDVIRSVVYLHRLNVFNFDIDMKQIYVTEEGNVQFLDPRWTMNINRTKRPLVGIKTLFDIWPVRDVGNLKAYAHECHKSDTNALIDVIFLIASSLPESSTIDSSIRKRSFSNFPSIEPKQRVKEEGAPEIEFIGNRGGNAGLADTPGIPLDSAENKIVNAEETRIGEEGGEGGEETSKSSKRGISNTLFSDLLKQLSEQRSKLGTPQAVYELFARINRTAPPLCTHTDLIVRNIFETMLRSVSFSKSGSKVLTKNEDRLEYNLRTFCFLFDQERSDIVSYINATQTAFFLFLTLLNNFREGVKLWALRCLLLLIKIKELREFNPDFISILLLTMQSENRDIKMVCLQILGSILDDPLPRYEVNEATIFEFSSHPIVFDFMFGRSPDFGRLFQVIHTKYAARLAAASAVKDFDVREFDLIEERRRKEETVNWPTEEELQRQALASSLHVRYPFDFDQAPRSTSQGIKKRGSLEMVKEDAAPYILNESTESADREISISADATELLDPQASGGIEAEEGRRADAAVGGRASEPGLMDIRESEPGLIDIHQRFKSIWCTFEDIAKQVYVGEESGDLLMTIQSLKVMQKLSASPVTCEDCFDMFTACGDMMKFAYRFIASQDITPLVCGLLMNFTLYCCPEPELCAEFARYLLRAAALYCRPFSVSKVLTGRESARGVKSLPSSYVLEPIAKAIAIVFPRLDLAAPGTEGVADAIDLAPCAMMFDAVDEPILRGTAVAAATMLFDVKYRGRYGADEAALDAKDLTTRAFAVLERHWFYPRASFQAVGSVVLLARRVPRLLDLLAGVDLSPVRLLFDRNSVSEQIFGWFFASLKQGVRPASDSFDLFFPKPGTTPQEQMHAAMQSMYSSAATRRPESVAL